MLHIGCHLSSSGGYLAMGKEALELNADTFAFFTRNPRGGAAKNIDPDDAAAFRSLASEHQFAPLVAHAPYTMNPCSADPALRDFAKAMMIDDLARMEYTPGSYYNFHPGSHVQQGAEAGIEFTGQMLASVIRPEQSSSVLIESMAGKGSEIGRTFEEIRAIIDRTEELLGCGTISPRKAAAALGSGLGRVQTVGAQTVPSADIPAGSAQTGGAAISITGQYKLGVCIDTCHLWDGGYDVVNDLDGVLTQFDNIIGLDRICAVHLNDSLNTQSAHKDRHAKIGEGNLGLEAIVRVINHPALAGLPFILETPNEHDGYKHEIALLRSKYRG